MAPREGTAPFSIPGIDHPCSTWYIVFGDLHDHAPNVAPLVLLHGGPGACHEYLLPLARALHAQHAIPCVLYDQIGNGQSTALPQKAGDLSFWTDALFLAELTNLVAHLGISDRYDVYGQSWGGMLGARHAITHPPGLRRLIASNAPADIRVLFESPAGIRKWMAQMPPAARAAIEEGERTRDFKSKAYTDAIMVFYERHLCRLETPPPELLKGFEHLENSAVYFDMMGPSEVTCIGSLKDWSVVDDCHKIAVPMLLVSGEFDEIADVSIQPFFDRVPRVRWASVDGASHMTHLEKPERYLELTSTFLLNP